MLRITRFILVSVVIIVVLYLKTNFFALEPMYFKSIVGRVDFLVTVAIVVTITGLFLIGLFSGRKEKFTTGRDKSRPFLVFGILSVLLFSLSLGVGKVSLEWDAIALYDARAKFLQQGIPFSEMPKISEYDFKNKYYYLLYPPFTSQVHAAVSSYLPNMTVSIIYPTLLIFLAIAVFLFSLEFLEFRNALLFTFLTVTAREIFISSTIEYSNLPFTLLILLSWLLLLSHVKKKDYWKFMAGAFILGASVWVRYLEPVWIAFVAAYFIATVKKGFKRSLVETIILFAIPAFQNRAWHYFVSEIGAVKEILVFPKTVIMDMVLAVFSGGLVRIILAFVSSWGLVAIVFFVALKIVKVVSAYQLFNISIIILTLFMYLGGLYLMSLEYYYWPELGGSMIRSGAFLYPVTIFTLIDYLKDKIELNKIKK